jgi:hypothetical protein
MHMQVKINAQTWSTDKGQSSLQFIFHVGSLFNGAILLA